MVTEASTRPHVRLAREADLATVHRIETESFADDPWTLGMLTETLHSADSVMIVAADSHEVLGYAAVLAAKGASEADVLTIAVDARARGRGVGRTLLVALATEAQARGAKLLFLEVRESNATARSLYRSEGFEHVGVRPKYYPAGDDGQREDAVMMRLDLHHWCETKKESA